MKSKAFDWTQAEFDHFLLQIAYVGTNYHGLAWQAPVKQFKSCQSIRKKPKINDDDNECTSERVIPTIERVILSVLERARLIQDRDSWYFMAMLICGTQKALLDCYDYQKIINNMLPSDIRILNVIKVPMWFDARSYKYFFHLKGLNISSMDEAAKHFLGVHNFQNFCKIDPSAPKTLTRRILQSEVRPINEHIGVYIVSSPAFLWHQVRCMTGSLMMIGLGKVPAGIIQRWLNIDETPTKPEYEMAPATGLVLWDCIFESFKSTDLFDGTNGTEPNLPYFPTLLEKAILDINILRAMNSA